MKKVFGGIRFFLYWLFYVGVIMPIGLVIIGITLLGYIPLQFYKGEDRDRFEEKMMGVICWVFDLLCFYADAMEQYLVKDE